MNFGKRNADYGILNFNSPIFFPLPASGSNFQIRRTGTGFCPKCSFRQPVQNMPGIFSPGRKRFFSAGFCRRQPPNMFLSHEDGPKRFGLKIPDRQFLQLSRRDGSDGVYQGIEGIEWEVFRHE